MFLRANSKNEVTQYYIITIFSSIFKSTVVTHQQLHNYSIEPHKTL